MAVKTGLGEGARALNIKEPFAIHRPEAEEREEKKETPSNNHYGVPLNFLDISRKTSNIIVDFYSSMFNPIVFWQKSQRYFFSNTRSVMRTVLRSLRL